MAEGDSEVLVVVWVVPAVDQEAEVDPGGVVETVVVSSSSVADVVVASEAGVVETVVAMSEARGNSRGSSQLIPSDATPREAGVSNPSLSSPWATSHQGMTTARAMESSHGHRITTGLASRHLDLT